MARTLASDFRAFGARIGAALSGAPGWVAGLITGAQAAVLGLSVVFAPALAVIAAAPTADGSTTIDWGSATGAATHLWLLAHGVPWVTAAADVTLAPLGLTLLSVAIVAAVTRRFAEASLGSGIVAVGAYAAVAVLAAALLDGADAQLGVTARGAAMVAAAGVALGLWRKTETAWGPWRSAPRWLRAGVHVGARSVGTTVMIATVVAVVWFFAGFNQVSAATRALNPDSVGGFGLAYGEVLYAPVLIAWAIAWLTGTGFSVGEGTLYAPSEIMSDALPNIPLLGALPSASGGVLVWAPVLLVVAGALAAMRHRRDIPGGRRALAAGATAVCVGAALLSVITELASGAIGPGRMAAVGADAGAVAFTGALWLLVGVALVLAAEWWRRSRNQPSVASSSGTDTPK